MARPNLEEDNNNKLDNNAQPLPKKAAVPKPKRPKALVVPNGDSLLKILKKAGKKAVGGGLPGAAGAQPHLDNKRAREPLDRCRRARERCKGENGGQFIASAWA